MHIGATAALVSPPQSLSPATFPAIFTSRLNPLQSRFSAAAARAATGSPDTQTHLANLEHILRRQSPLPPQPAPTASPFVGLLLPALRLPPLFQRRDAEEASPRSLAHLNHLLSDSAVPSPRRSISGRWREFHGFCDWSGLLDPLDPDLRREVLHYGDFIHSAYHAFFNSPSFSVDSPRPVAFPDRSYRLTRHLFATSSIDPPSWLPSWTSHRTSWIGFVAVCDSDREIRRMGRRNIVVALRGTSTCLEWAENLRANLVPLDEDDGNGDKSPKVECGFRNLYKTAGDRHQSLSSAVVEEVRRLVELYKGEELSITVTGHSLGAALAVLTADELASSSPEMPPVAVFSFGGPRVGNRAFAQRVERRKGVKVLRVVNAHDLVTRVPGLVKFPAEIAGRLRDGYEHVGRELRVDSRVSPFLKPDADLACCHDLEAYLHLVDGLGGGGGFRPNAKRSLVRLLSQQRGNVKKLYVRKARALGLDQDEDARRAGSGCVANI
ncbi:Phospholipase A1-Ibeta2, chloroplastic [Apostasia shenzhenica]|uniref:Phospholipase A1-Ibeta2, chloroplastic n=1 Tax=Apostasia shenzhenica TaxID=1088818 RepID=A0A2I0AYT8_9ASPA|nr:Phospholipase A1-Ibeta2, chloroplastic [Apostasia shenzhenica]